jgi:hypothetical protein
MPTNNQPEQAVVRSSGVGALVRFGWIAVGFIGIVMTAMSIAARPAWSFGFRDAAFWGVVVITALLRYIDVTHFHGDTANGQPATVGDLRRYLLGLVVASSGAWVLAQSIHI